LIAPGYRQTLPIRIQFLEICVAVANKTEKRFGKNMEVTMLEQDISIKVPMLRVFSLTFLPIPLFRRSNGVHEKSDIEKTPGCAGEQETLRFFSANRLSC
jgi:hypothetical protein